MLRQRSEPLDLGDEIDVLRIEVVHGPRAGATMALDVDRPLHIGHAYDNDVVLRHPSTQGVRVRLERDDTSVTVHVEEGEIGLFGVRLEAGRSMALPKWVPFSIGDAMLAIGPDDPAGWRACQRLARESAVAKRPPALARPEAESPAQGLEPEPVRLSLTRFWPAVALALALPVLGTAVWMAQSSGGPSGSTQGPAAPEPIRAWLSEQGYPQLRVQADPSGSARIEGWVDQDEDRVRLAEGLAAAGLQAQLALTSGEQIARQVGDVLRLNGVRAEVSHQGRGLIHARLHEPDAERRARAEAAVRRDVQGLAGFTVEAVADAPVPRPAPPLAVDPGKRVVTVVYGRGGYVVTADGARYFEGAFLPSGHRIARIETHNVELERDGEISRLAL